MKKFRDMARKGQPFVDDLHRILNHMHGRLGDKRWPRLGGTRAGKRWNGRPIISRRRSLQFALA